MPWLTIKAPGGPAVVQRLDAGKVTIGRGEEADLELLDPAVSRRHAEVVQGDESWEVRDLGSRNGTLLNGDRLEGAAPLEPGDQVAIGDTVVWFETSESLARRRGTERETLELHAPRQAQATTLVGRSPQIGRVLDLVERVAPRDMSVLITGENGTGKELVASLLHQRSPRRDGPFVVVNCPAVPGSLFESQLFGVERGVATGVEERVGYVEQAEGGTLFLDEIGDLDLSVQAKLLRLLQERTYERVGASGLRTANVRFIAATNHDLERAIGAGRFRRDLYHRLHVLNIHVPPLRERMEDVPLLAEHFLRLADGPGRRLTEAALACLNAHDYPGNVRELGNALLGASVMADGPEVDAEHLPDRLRSGAADADATAVRPHEQARLLLDEVLDGRETFWTAIHAPFLRRELPRETARAFVVLALERGGGRYKDMARLLGIEDQRKKMLDFLRNHDLQA